MEMAEEHEINFSHYLVTTLDNEVNTLEPQLSCLKGKVTSDHVSYSASPFPSSLDHLTLIYSENSAKYHSLQKTSDFSLTGSGISSRFFHNLYIPTHVSCNFGPFVCSVTSLWTVAILIHLSVHNISHSTWHVVNCQSVFID